MRTAEYIASRLAQAGIRHAFLVTGGGAMFLNDAFCHEPQLSPTFFHHEQAAAMAAEAYARIAGGPAVLNVTTGPGGMRAKMACMRWPKSPPPCAMPGM